MTANHETAVRCVAAQKKADAWNDRDWDRETRSNPHKSRRLAEIRAAGSRVSAQAEIYGPFLPRVESPWPVVPGLDTAPAVIESGRIRRVGDADETAPALAVQQTRDFRFLARVESTYQAVCREETGQVETAAETAKREKKEARLRAQGHVVSKALESVGKVGYRDSAWSLWAVDVHELTADAIPQFRRICLNPWIAYRLRLPYLNWLEYWMQDHPHCRFWTLTSGQRCQVQDLEARIVELHRRVSKLNAADFMKSAGVEIVFRSTEFGTVEKSERKADVADLEETAGDVETDTAGNWYHPHAHCIVWLKKGKLPPWEWTGLMEKVWQFWGDEWDEGRRIRDVRECVKYVVKPGDMVRLAEENPAELGRLHEVVFRKKLVQPMGELARVMRAADKSGLMPALRWLNDRRRWTLIRDPNRSYSADGSEKSGLKDFLGNNLTNTGARKALTFSQEGFRFPDAPEPDVCQVIARCVPAFNSRGVKSPRVIVMGTRLCLDTVSRHPLVRRIRSATRADYEAGLAIACAERRTLALSEPDAGCVRSERREAARISLDTGTPTVRPETAAPPEYLDFESGDPPELFRWED